MNRNQVQFLDLNFENVPRSLESGWETSSNVILETAVSLKHIFETPSFKYVFPARLAAATCTGASLIRKSTALGPYRRPLPRVIGGS